MLNPIQHLCVFMCTQNDIEMDIGSQQQAKRRKVCVDEREDEPTIDSSIQAHQTGEDEKETDSIDLDDDMHMFSDFDEGHVSKRCVNS